ncbi:ribosome biogenesis regulatory protein homolog [Aplysia californica]|uniref:Ribosome biogenesis regulatory protein n=1 Tax=Aplysia californica TaxID=6500 RepID=A0ABM0JKX0_APLCA|nr:ribosome biogenesis regulatory protein homolog [Aplysia californica]
MAATQSVVDSILSTTDDSKFKTIQVDSAELIELDEGNLLAVNENKVDTKEFRKRTEEILLSSTRDATQCLFNSLWQLPVEQVEGAYVVKLPEPKTWLPREKPVPKKKPLTKWQEYAKSKGILNKKKSRMVWDELSQEYKPRWGYKRANDDTQEWAIEVPDNADPMEDQFAKRKNAKKERVAKNELQRLRNIARSQKSKVPGVGLTPTEKPSKDQLSKALAVAHKSTASIGKFTDRLPKEKPSRFTGKKRKFEPSIGNLKSEKEKQLNLIETNAKKLPKIDMAKATNRALRQEEQTASREKQSRKTPKKAKGKKALGLGKKASGGRTGGGNKKTRGKRKR